MIFFVLILLLLIFNRTEISKPGEFNKDYISPDGTLAVKARDILNSAEFMTNRISPCKVILTKW